MFIMFQNSMNSDSSSYCSIALTYILYNIFNLIFTSLIIWNFLPFILITVMIFEAQVLLVTYCILLIYDYLPLGIMGNLVSWQYIYSRLFDQIWHAPQSFKFNLFWFPSFCCLAFYQISLYPYLFDRLLSLLSLSIYSYSWFDFSPNLFLL